MRKVLMISYYYPPLENVGSLRALGFSKYLPKHGWEPYVLTVADPDPTISIFGKEPPPPGISVIRAREPVHLNKLTSKANGLLNRIVKPIARDPARNIFQDWFCIPDGFVSWILPCVLKGLEIIDRKEIDLVYVSCKPFSSALSGVILKKLRGKPLVVDFRDPISFSSMKSYDQLVDFHSRAVKRLERHVLMHADRLLVTSDETKKEYERIYPAHKGKVERIYNGFMMDLPSLQSLDHGDRFTITYSGNFYHREVSSHAFFAALRDLIAEGVIPRGALRFLYMGEVKRNSDWISETVDAYGLGGVMETTGHISPARTHEMMFRSSLLLLKNKPRLIPAKLYEYLATGVPILALVSKGEVEEMIRSYSRNSYVITSGEAIEIANAISDAYNKWSEGRLERSVDESFRVRFSRESLTQEFARLLDATIGSVT